jgi:superfamily I DNA/RNA helicase
MRPEERCGVPVHELRSDELPPKDRIAIGTMLRAKGLEFRVVVVKGCEDGLLPLDSVFGDVTDEADRAAFVEQDRNLLCVATARARERLLLSHSGPRSRFVGDGGSRASS